MNRALPLPPSKLLPDDHAGSMSAVGKSSAIPRARGSSAAIGTRTSNQTAPLPSVEAKKTGVSDNIRVFVRFRPTAPDDFSLGAWDITDRSVVEASAKGAPFVFNRVFAPEITNADVYDQVARPVLDQVVQGYNGTIFAYGQTGSGKTFTMSGTDQNPGIILRLIRDLFAFIDKHPESLFLIRVSYLEIYNEEIRDLLADPKEIRGKYMIRETGDQFFVQGLKEHIVTSQEEVESVISTGNVNRTVGVSNLNEHSSRSHALFRLVLESTTRLEMENDAPAAAGGSKLTGLVKVSELNLVDLAGSETLSSDLGAAQQKETKAINLSLTQLKTVITCLSKSESHIPYRNSSLTKLLRNSLGGNAKTSVICTATPVAAQAKITKNTLFFGALAKDIKNQVHVNEFSNDNEKVMIRQYQRRIEDLEKQLSDYQEVEAQKRKIQQDYQALKDQLAAIQAKEEEQRLAALEMKRMMGSVVHEHSGPSPSASSFMRSFSSEFDKADEAKRKAAAVAPAAAGMNDEELSKLRQQLEQLEKELQVQQLDRKQAQDLVAQKLEALRQEKALAAEMEQQLKDLNAQRAEVLRQKEVQQKRFDELQKQIEESGLDRDSYLARLIDEYEDKLYVLNKNANEALSLKEAEKLEVLEALKRADRKLKADAAREQDREREWEQKLARAQSSAAESKYGAVSPAPMSASNAALNLVDDHSSMGDQRLKQELMAAKADLARHQKESEATISQLTNQVAVYQMQLEEFISHAQRQQQQQRQQGQPQGQPQAQHPNERR